jgi:hypothetical protein
MRCSNWLAVSTLLSFAVLTGCGDGIVVPSEAPSAAPAPIRLAPTERPSLSLSGGAPDSATVDFTISPNGGVVFVGNHALVFPARSVCDPATSSYGAGTWDSPCAALERPLAVRAEVRRRDGRTWVDFTPSLRFVPSNSPSQWVWMLMHTPEAAGGSSDISRFSILWAKSIGGPVVDEAREDASMRTYVDSWSGISMRRIKHFSGYTSGSGRSEGDEEPPEQQ